MRLFLSLFICILIWSNPAEAREIVINIPEYRLTLLEGGHILKSYDIAVGTAYEQTPTGSYRIMYKEMFPTWYPGAKFEDQSPVPAGPENPLGTRWMEFHPTYGIHGTNKGWDIQYPVSGGCIRMHDKDAQELYDQVDIGTPVSIIYETILFEDRPDGLYVKVFPDIYHLHYNTPERFMRLYAPFAARYPGASVPPLPHPQADISEIIAVKVAATGTEPPAVRVPAFSLPPRPPARLP